MQYMNQYPQPYQTQVQAPMDRLAQLQAQQYQPTQQANQSLLYVQGEAAAKSWMVGAGQSVLLMDSENPVFYIKSADNSGIPLPLRVFDYKERSQSIPQSTIQSPEPIQTNLDDKYVTRKEYDDLHGKYMEIMDRLNNFHTDSTNTGAKKTTTSTGRSRSKGGSADE